ncbi:MAG TPA: amino acid adenylation domain-containing protein [Nitrosospira sp.]|nr:amino acid adenylation domain-containing protein [Nitrosospira sp.]
MPKNYNLACAISHHGREAPQAPAVVCNGQSLTYAELAERAAVLAARITGSPGWQRNKGQPQIGILASRGIDACVALLGACWAGATYVPISLKQPEERILSLLGQCRLSAIIADDIGMKLLTERLVAVCPQPIIHTSFAATSDRTTGSVQSVANPRTILEEPVLMTPSDTAYIIFTSGTTGAPKGVMISAGAVRHYVTTIVEQLGLRATDRALETCEISFDFSVHNMFSTWEAGASLHILPANKVMNAVKFVRNSALTVWNSVPSLAGMLRQVKALAPGSLACLRITVFGGEQLPASTVTAWQNAAPSSVIVNLYGPTEATVFCLAQVVAIPLPLTPERDVIAIGTPLPGNDAAVIDKDGQTLPDGSTGELVIAGKQLADGYLEAPELNAARFPTLNGKRWYRTGDRAIRDAAGRFHCLGRIDNQVKVLGYRVELEEIDAHLRVVSGADVVGSVAWPLADGMASGIVSFVDTSEIAAERIIDLLKTRVPPYMLPNRIIFLKKMPLNPNGKVDRSTLRQLLENDPA